jgi:hypothetical protein
MVPPGQSDINPEVNAVQTLISVKQQNKWSMALFQNTPAAFQGRPELSERLTEGCDRLCVLHTMKSIEEALLMLSVFNNKFCIFLISYNNLCWSYLTPLLRASAVFYADRNLLYGPERE